MDVLLRGCKNLLVWFYTKCGKEIKLQFVRKGGRLETSGLDGPIGGDLRASLECGVCEETAVTN